MSVTEHFKHSTGGNGASHKTRKKRPSPFCIRLSEQQREHLTQESGGLPLGAYIKAKALGDAPLPKRKSGLSIQDREALAKTLALLGQSRLSSNLNQLAHAVNIGVLPVTPETEALMQEALQDIRKIRALLIQALGKKAERDQC